MLVTINTTKTIILNLDYKKNPKSSTMYNIPSRSSDKHLNMKVWLGSAFK